MAQDQDDLDSEIDEPQKGSKNKLLLIVGALVIIAVTAAATLYFVGDTSQSSRVDGEEAPAENAGKANYFPLEPPFIVNFMARGKPRLIQVSIVLMTRDKEVLSGLGEHQALIRNSTILRIGGAQFESLQTIEGKELLRQDLLDEINRILESEGINLIDDLYFTNFVMQ